MKWLRTPIITSMASPCCQFALSLGLFRRKEHGGWRHAAPSVVGECCMLKLLLAKMGNMTPDSAGLFARHMFGTWFFLEGTPTFMGNSGELRLGVPRTGLRFFTVYGPWGRPDMFAFSATIKIHKGVLKVMDEPWTKEVEITWVSHHLDGWNMMKPLRSWFHMVSPQISQQIEKTTWNSPTCFSCQRAFWVESLSVTRWIRWFRKRRWVYLNMTQHGLSLMTKSCGGHSHQMVSVASESSPGMPSKVKEVFNHLIYKWIKVLDFQCLQK